MFQLWSKETELLVHVEWQFGGDSKRTIAAPISQRKSACIERFTQRSFASSDSSQAELTFALEGPDHLQVIKTHSV